MPTAPDTLTLPPWIEPAILDALADALAERIAPRVIKLVSEAADDVWLDGHAAARYLGMPYSTFKRKTAAGIIEGRRNPDGGRRLYYRRSYLDDWRGGNRT